MGSALGVVACEWQRLVLSRWGVIVPWSCVLLWDVAWILQHRKDGCSQDGLLGCSLSPKTYTTAGVPLCLFNCLLTKLLQPSPYELCGLEKPKPSGIQHTGYVAGQVTRFGCGMQILASLLRDCSTWWIWDTFIQNLWCTEHCHVIGIWYL